MLLPRTLNICLLCFIVFCYGRESHDLLFFFSPFNFPFIPFDFKRVVHSVK